MGMEVWKKGGRLVVIWWFVLGVCVCLGSYPNISSMNIPEDASILVNFEHFPHNTDPKGIRCRSLVEGRECMNVSELVPIYDGA